jgi:hypothetical protein
MVTLQRGLCRTPFAVVHRKPHISVRCTSSASAHKIFSFSFFVDEVIKNPHTGNILLNDVLMKKESVSILSVHFFRIKDFYSYDVF